MSFRPITNFLKTFFMMIIFRILIICFVLMAGSLFATDDADDLTIEASQLNHRKKISNQ